MPDASRDDRKFYCVVKLLCCFFFFFSSRRRHTRYWRDWSSDVCSSDLEAVAFIARRGDAPIHFAQGRAGDLANILVRELGAAIHPRVVAFGSAFRFMDQRAALEACDRCGADGVALAFGTSAPSPWRAIVADIIVDVARSRITTRTGVKNEAMAPIFAGSAFSHVSRWRTEMRLERSAQAVAVLAAFYAMRAGIVVGYAAGTEMMRA